MIVSLSVSNFRSFLEEQTFSLVASKRLSGMHEDHTVAIPGSDEKVLRAGVLYGANGAGKSNLLKALRYMRQIALMPRRKNRGTGRETFRFDDSSIRPSTFDLQFVAKNKLYRFGFAVDDERVTQEWLVLVTGTREKPVYERITDQQGKVQIEAPGLKSASLKLSALITVGGPQNQSFLATVRANLEPQDVGEELSAVLEWFDDGLSLVGPNDIYGSLGDILSKDSGFQTFSGDFLRAAATGVDRLQVEKKALSEEELRTLIPGDLAPTLVENLKAGTATGLRWGGREIVIEKGDDDRFYQVTIQAAHKHKTKGAASLELFEESDGTQRLLELLPALYHMKTNNAVYFIDEIDRSMHPTLVYKFMEFFLKSCGGKACQIIATTHETNLLDLNLLRRDEIWFAEKNNDGATELYSLTDYNVRKDLQIRKGYLEGRFGAVPFLSGLDHLRETSDRSKYS